MRTTPTEALEILLGLPRLKIWIKREAVAAYLRIRNAGLWKGREDIKGHAKVTRVVEEELAVLTLKPPVKEYRIGEAKVKYRIPSREDWMDGTEYPPPGDILVYTDGSKVLEENRTGSGIYIKELHIEEAIALGSLTTVFQAETFAILWAAQHQAMRELKRKSIVICTDSQAAIKALKSNKQGFPLVDECRASLEELAKENTVTLMWIPGHEGHEGNEKADELARTGSGRAFCGPEPALGLTKQTVATILDRWCTECTNANWKGIMKCRQSKHFIKAIDVSKTRKLLSLSRGSLSCIVGILTGHCGLRRHMSLMKVVPDAICKACGREEETVEHFIGRCDRYAMKRFALLGEDILKDEEVWKRDWWEILEFVRATGRLDPVKVSGSP